jgi:methylenetetrahydrofolate dehydrogenase (NADP+)/methenyltetrahydrofolate cyclohydrolase
MAKILKGADVTAAMNDALIREVEDLKARNVRPALAIVRVGERDDDVAYERGAMKRCERIGVAVESHALPGDATQADLLEVIRSINRNPAVHGCLLFRPLPGHIDEETVRRALAPEKDVDGITDGSLAGVFAGTQTGFPPCTAQACMEILDHFGIELKGRRVVVIGRSLVVGKPVAMMLLGRHATVTLCHTRTVDLPSVARNAEILIVAAGKANVVGKESLSEGQVVIDVGIHSDEQGNLCGDVRFGEAEAVVAAITPVPGGVGTVTTSVLVKHVVEAARKAAGR